MSDSVTSQLFISLLVILFGYFLKTVKLIRQSDGEALARIVFNVTLPALIITTFSKVTIDYSLLSLSAFSLIYGCLMALLGILFFQREARSTRGIMSMVLPGFNIGLFAYPLIEVIWGQEGITYFGMFDIGNALVTFGLCYLLANHYSVADSSLDVKTIFTRLSKSVPLMSYLAGFFIALLGITLPEPVVAFTGLIAKANGPLSLLLLGVYLSFSFSLSHIKQAGKVLAFRYVIGLAVGLAIFFIAPFGELFKYTVLVGLILPIATAVIPFAIEFHYDQKFVGAVANMTIVISFALVWVITGTSLIN
ncbi:MAG: AEC family transporter [Sporomusaceae bacterium]|nr:AEC family transporter [Sporomusaceae bacterium]